MQQIKQSESTAARRRIPFYMIDSSDGVTPKTGQTLSAGDLKISKDGGTEANHGGTLTELAAGLYFYEPTSSEVDTLGFLTFRLAKTGVVPFVALVQIVAFDPYDIAALGLTRIDAAVTTRAATGAAMTLDFTQAVPTTNTAQTVGDALNAARAQGFGKWVRTGTTLTLYASNGSTVVHTFTLDSATSPTSRS